MPGPSASASDFSASGNTLLIGRERERKELLASLADAVAGRGRIFLLSGEPGVGKSRLADELAAEAGRCGAQTAWGGCEAVDAPAYWPWTQVIRSCVRRSDLKTAVAQMGFGADAVSSIVPELRGSITGPNRPRVVSPSASVIGQDPQAPELERFRLFDSIANFLRNFAAAVPLLIVLDDIHAADVDSLLLLRFLGRDLRSARIMLLATYREAEVRASQRLTEVVGDLQREASYIPLRGLSETDTGAFVEGAAGWLPAPGIVAALFRATEGNPFFLSQILRLLIAEGRLEQVRPSSLEAFDIPDGVRNTIRRRLGLVAQPARDCLQLASVIGRDFGFGLVRSLSGLPDERLLAALEAAISAGLVSRVPASLDRYRFSHFLIRETLYGDQPIAVRQQLHLKVAENLERLYHGSARSHLSELAYHYAHAIPSAPLEKVFEYSRDAAMEAMAVHAYDEAARLYATALEALQPGDPQAERLRFETMLSLGSARHGAGLFHQCRVTFEQAAEIARKLNSPKDLARAALGRAMPITESGVIDETLIALLEEALSGLGDGDERSRAMLMARLSWEIYWGPDRERRVSLARSAVAMARRLGDIPTLTYVLYYTLLALWTPENLKERRETASEIIRLAEDFSEYESLRARYLRFVYLLESGDIQAAREELEACRDLTAKIRQPYGVLEMCEASLAFLEGRFDEGLRAAARAMTIAESLEGRAGHFRQTYYSFELLLTTEQGRTTELEQMMKALVSRSRDAPFRSAAPAVARCILALIYCDNGRVDDAAADFEDLAVDDFGYLPKDMAWLSALVLLSEVCVRLGDRNRAAALYSALAPYASRNPLLTWHVCYGPVCYYLGRLAATMGRFDESESHFEAALRLNRRMGARPWAAHAQHQYAVMLLERAQIGDREKALKLAEAALAAASTLRMTALAGKAEAVRGRAQEESPKEETVLPATPVADSESPPAALRNAFHREGEVWTICFGGKLFRLKDSKGLGYIAHLIRHPGMEFHSMDLLTGAIDATAASGEAAQVKATVDGHRDEQLASMGLRRGTPGDAGPMLDAEAKAAYRRRIGELREEAEEAREAGDVDRAERAQEEIDAIAKELSRAVGLGGRDRRAAAESEKARANVSRAIKAAIERLGEHDASLAAHLGAMIKTGTFCRYLVDPKKPVQWEP